MAKKNRVPADIAAWDAEELRQQEAEESRVSADAIKKAFATYVPPKGVVPENADAMVMDAAPFGADLIGVVNSSSTLQQLVHEGIGFPGYPYLSALLMRGEYINIVHTLSREFFRTWGKFVSKGDDDKSERIDRLHAAMERMNVRSTLKKLFEHDLTFGAGRAVVLTRNDKNDGELATPLALDKAKIGNGAVTGFRVVEPIWMTPQNYETADPLSPSFYVPDAWWVLAKKIDTTRIIEVISRPLPDILKPAWNFGGIPLCLMAKPYVQNWLRTRQNVSDIINTLRLMVVTTNQADQSGGGLKTKSGNLRRRIQLLQKTMDNFGVLLLNTNENFQNVTTPLSELAELQAQSLEQICSITNIPVVKFTSNQPQGLNASSDGEIRTFYDTGMATRENVIAPALKRMTDMIQISELGEIDPDLEWQWDSLFEETPVDKLDMEVKKAQIREADIASGQISPEEGRKQIAGDEDSIYAASGVGLDTPAPVDDYPGGEGEENDLPPVTLPKPPKPSGERNDGP
ncbi:phage portal protein [Novacetimonas pomaceti]|uniref:phage portal protein n=1 Tax=Novacetimonas pomaceti TaxID=2021998 RepID=UPI001C2DE9C2|nr:DUF1073 domain-containing protein [Novacetimonas pomaceti]MBV1833067.1 DUF1073 domain-containing protein [Novacetimonas pomaceti]